MLAASTPMMYPLYVRNPTHRCEFCRWVDVHPLPKRPLVIALGCLQPMTHYGQAARGGLCCSFEREPGADDEMPLLGE